MALQDHVITLASEPYGSPSLSLPQFPLSFLKPFSLPNAEILRTMHHAQGRVNAEL